LLDILKEKSEHINEVETLLSLAGFKKLEDDQKYWAKMEMLGIMRRAKIWCSATVCTTVMKNDYSEFFLSIPKNYNE